MTATRLIPRGRVLAPAEIDQGFGDGSLFSRSAYRLELLDEYDSPSTRERMRLWLAGEPQGEDTRRYWDRVIGNAVRRGATMTRVHVLPDGPLPDYLRFELDFYRGSVAAGEDIRIVPARLTAGVELPSFDYWLFDSARVAVMYYGGRGAWLRSELVTDPDFVAACQRWRDAALSKAIPLSTYMAERSAA